MIFEPRQHRATGMCCLLGEVIFWVGCTSFGWPRHWRTEDVNDHRSSQNRKEALLAESRVENAVHELSSQDRRATGPKTLKTLCFRLCALLKQNKAKQKKQVYMFKKTQVLQTTCYRSQTCSCPPNLYADTLTPIRFYKKVRSLGSNLV